MHVEASQGHKAVVHLLLNLGADPDIKDVYGRTPKDEAQRSKSSVSRGHQQIKELLTTMESDANWDDGVWSAVKQAGAAGTAVRAMKEAVAGTLPPAGGIPFEVGDAPERERPLEVFPFKE